MPARPYVFAILLFWMATTGWMFHRDLWPRLRPNEPPPYTIDLADEALVNQAPEILWNVYRGDKLMGHVSTWVQYHEPDDTFELHCRGAELKLAEFPILGQIEASEVTSVYRVSHQGELRGIEADVSISAKDRAGSNRTVLVQLHVEGRIEDQRFVPHGYLNLLGRKSELQLEPVTVSAQTNILNPLHPVNRISGLRPGRHWRVPLIDPLGDSFKGWVKKNVGTVPGSDSEMQILQAEVLGEPQLLSWHDKEVSCLVIDYKGDNLTARTWVRESDGLVLRQEGTLMGEKLVLERDRVGKPVFRRIGHK